MIRLHPASVLRHSGAALVAVLSFASFAPAARAQQSGGMAGMPGMPGMDHHPAPAPLTPKTRAEIADVFAALAPLSTTRAAQAAGFEPQFGWIATMGVHWVDIGRMTKGAQSTLRSPDNLMFSRINGRDSLVGAAYAYVTAAGDTAVPSLFDSHPAWHEHENLAPPGMTLVMLHVWFVASPDGPFAGTNPNLPFWAAGLEAPDDERRSRLERPPIRRPSSPGSAGGPLCSRCWRPSAIQCAPRSSS
jgi:hypothetical protein